LCQPGPGVSGAVPLCPLRSEGPVLAGENTGKKPAGGSPGGLRAPVKAVSGQLLFVPGGEPPESLVRSIRPGLAHVGKPELPPAGGGLEQPENPACSGALGGGPAQWRD